MDVQTQWNSTLELLQRASRLWEFTCKWLKNPKYSDFRPLFSTQDERTIVKYVMEDLRAFRYSTLWMSKRHTVTLHHMITVYHDMFNHMDGVMWALAKKQTQWMDNLYFTMKVSRQKLSQYYGNITAMTGLLDISAHILDSSWKSGSLRTWDKAMDINPEDETCYCTQYQEAFLKYVENKYCAKHRRMSVINLKNEQHSHFFPSAKASGFGQSSFDPHDLSSDDDVYLTPN